MKHKSDEKKEEIEWEPAPIMNCSYYDHQCSKVLISVDGQFLGWFYVIDFEKDRPIEAIPAPKQLTSYLKFRDFGDELMIGFRDGSWQVRHKNDLKLWL